MPGHHRRVERAIEIEIGLEGLGLFGRYQKISAAGGDRFAERRIERGEIVRRHFSQARGQLHVDLVRRGNFHEVGAILQAVELDAVAAGGQHDVLYRDQLGHIVARFRRQLEAEEIGRQALALIGGDGAAHTAFTAVVGGEGQLPGVEHAVQFLQIVEGRVGRHQNIAAAIVLPILFQAEVAAGGGNELPHAGGIGARVGLRVERAFDDRQQYNLGRHIAPLDFLDDVIHVLGAALDEALDVILPRRIPELMVLDQGRGQRVHGEAAADALPQVGITLRDRFARGGDFGLFQRLRNDGGFCGVGLQMDKAQCGGQRNGGKKCHVSY